MRSFSDDGHVPGLRRFPWRFMVYGCVLLYLMADLYVFTGPLKRSIIAARGGDSAAAKLAQSERVVATVYAHPIRVEDLHLAVQEHCLRRGLDINTLPRKRHNEIRSRVLNELVVDRLIWFHSYHNPVELEDSELQMVQKKTIERMAIPNSDTEAALAAQGMDPARLNSVVDNLTHQQAWLEKTIAPHIRVENAEIRARYDRYLREEGGASTASAATIRAEISATLEAEKRDVALAALINQLRRKAEKHTRYYSEFLWVE